MAKRTKTGGRRRGTPNKATAEIKDLAREHSVEAVSTLAALMRNHEVPPAARVAAARELLDRGHGKAPQAIVGPDGASALSVTIVHEHLD
jgi:hypothetical protein